MKQDMILRENFGSKKYKKMTKIDPTWCKIGHKQHLLLLDITLIIHTTYKTDFTVKNVKKNVKKSEKKSIFDDF